MVVRRWGAEEDEVRCGGLEYFGGEQVEEVVGCMATQREGGADSWIRRERIMHSALPFWAEV